MPVQALFKPFHLGALELPTRVVMAPMTRSFSPGGVPNSKVIEYYRRRAAAGVGLIITEGTTVGHIASNGYPNVPQFFGDAPLAGWKKVVDAVHAARSFRNCGTSAAYVALAPSRTPAYRATVRRRNSRTARSWFTV
jgi:2,4-dienoyl-CoA reductase-like NADH-dependent reductase (Old Yellow Enzyme family)